MTSEDLSLKHYIQWAEREVLRHSTLGTARAKVRGNSIWRSLSSQNPNTLLIEKLPRPLFWAVLLVRRSN